jgi:mannose-6-phosphate isomerase-like protein (cupin superfamily)
MKINRFVQCFLGAAVASAIGYAQAPRPEKLYTSAAEITAMMAKAKAERKDQPNIIQPVLSLAPYAGNLEYRASVGPAASHAKDAEMFYVVDGAGTLITGGKITDEKPQNPDNMTGTGITGGQSRQVAKGDFIIVPEGVPHWFSKIDSTLVLMSLHVPRPVK